VCLLTITHLKFITPACTKNGANQLEVGAASETGRESRTPCEVRPRKYCQCCALANSKIGVKKAEHKEGDEEQGENHSSVLKHVGEQQGYNESDQHPHS
jgi:hypothetical protein